MAKGFTVKAKAPTKSSPTEPEYDYDKAKEMLKGNQLCFACQVGEFLIHI